MRVISKFQVDDQVYEAIELARRQLKTSNGATVQVSQAEWLRNAVRAQLLAQGAIVN